MRIVAGAFKGRGLVAPKGRDTRPTADRTRESIFNVLAHASWAPPLDGARVIDLFAGSGALGLEAISRGASFALFVETDPGARGAIRENADALGVMGITRIHRRDAQALGEKPAGLGNPFDLAFLDPPYRQGLVEPALARLGSGGWLAEDAVAVVETAHDEPDVIVEGFATEDARRYGEAKVCFLKKTR
jgi:16S rRNA (guanine966-N2)-methyltransferase